MTLLNPTNGQIRNDSQGSGFFHASRRSNEKGRYLHKGVDFFVEPGQSVLSPISGKIIRELQVYSHTDKYRGCEIANFDICLKLFYVDTNLSLVGEHVAQGEVIGSAQDKNHIHLEVVWVNPLILM
jgi:hypothetical protein